MRAPQRPFAAIAVVTLLATAAAVMLFARTPATDDESPEAGLRPASGPTGNSLAWMALLGWPEPDEAPSPAVHPLAAFPHGRKSPEAEAPRQAASEPAPAVVAPAPVERPPPPSAPLVVTEQPTTDFASQVLALVNGERAARGIAPLAGNAALTQGALDYARTLTQLGSLSHAALGNLSSRVLATGYTGSGHLGEALWFGGGAVSPDHTVASWLASPAHNALILDPAFVVAGSGCSFLDAGDVHEVRCVLIVGG